MAMRHLISLLSLVALVLGAAHFQHSPVDIAKRQAGPVANAAITTSATGSVLTVITPSPGATPVSITTQSQTVTSFIPQYTACLLPPVAQAQAPTPSSWPTTRPYLNYTASWDDGPGSCTVVYSPTITTVCQTTLSGIAERYTITSCNQNVTFSTQYGYALVTATPTAANLSSNATLPATITAGPSLSVRTLTSYFIASWQALTTAGPPADVDIRICTTYPNGTQLCVLEYQVWVPATLTYTSTSTTSINLTTAISNGPSQIIFETITANVTERFTTFSMYETVELAYSIESETYTSSNRSTPATSTDPTVYQTWTVQQASSTSADGRVRRTTTVRRTSTVWEGTTTLPAPSSSATHEPLPGEEGGPNPAVVRPTATPTFDVTSILAGS